MASNLNQTKPMNNTEDMTTDEAWDFLLKSQIATENELKLISNIMGHNLEAMEAVLYARTGYRCFSQLQD